MEKFFEGVVPPVQTLAPLDCCEQRGKAKKKKNGIVSQVFFSLLFFFFLSIVCL